MASYACFNAAPRLPRRNRSAFAFCPTALNRRRIMQREALQAIVRLLAKATAKTVFIYKIQKIEFYLPGGRPEKSKRENLIKRGVLLAWQCWHEVVPMRDFT